MALHPVPLDGCVSDALSHDSCASVSEDERDDAATSPHAAPLLPFPIPHRLFCVSNAATSRSLADDLRSTHMPQLMLRNVADGDSILCLLAHFLPLHPELEHIAVLDCVVQQAGIVALCSVLGKLPRLATVTFDHTPLGDIAIVTLCTALFGALWVTRLRLCACRATGASAHALAQWVARAPRHATLDVTGNAYPCSDSVGRLFHDAATRWWHRMRHTSDSELHLFLPEPVARVCFEGLLRDGNVVGVSR